MMGRAEQLRRAEWAVCLGATLAAIGLHIVYLTHAGRLWRDEASGLQLATLPTVTLCAVAWQNARISER